MPPLVLAYHAVARELTPGLVPEMVVSADALVAEIARLRASGRRLVTAGALTGADDEAVLTFDDGWADALTVAAPLLAELGAPATFFLCPGLFGNADDNGFSPEGRVLTREEAVELAALASSSARIRCITRHCPTSTTTRWSPSSSSPRPRSS